MRSAQQPFSFVVPVIGPRKAPSVASTSITVQKVDGHRQHVQETVLYDEPLTEQHCQTRATKVDGFSGGCDQTAISTSGESTVHSPKVSYPFCSVGSDGDSKYDGCDEDEDSDEGGENDAIHENGATNHYDGTKQPIANTPLPEADDKTDLFTAEERPIMTRYKELDDADMEMVMDAGYCLAEVMAADTRIKARLLSDLKRARWQISEDEEIKQLQHQRTKRIKREEEPARTSSQGFPESHGHCTDDDLHTTYSKSSHKGNRKNHRTLSQYIQKLHKDRLRHRILQELVQNVAWLWSLLPAGHHCVRKSQ